MKKDWFRDWFSNKYYLELYKHRDEKDAIDLINLIQRNINLIKGYNVLDICCGSGRHSIELAKRGYDVTGFDLSKFLIGEAVKNKNLSPEKNLKLKFFIKDMRNFNFNHSFDLAINIFSSFGYFENDKENFSVFKNVSSSLKNGGFFVFDFLNESFLRKNLIRENFVVLKNKKVILKRRIENNLIFKDIKIGEKVFSERIKLYSIDIIKKELQKNNLNVQKIFGDYYGNKFKKYESKRFIIITKKV